MKENSFSFSIEDFLAYLFPGTIMILAIAAFLRLSPFKYLLTEISLNLVTGLILVACAYFAGISISSLMASVEGYLEKLFNLSNPTITIPLEGFEVDVMKAFNDIFGDHGSWSCNHFYVARAFVREKMPNCARVIERQDSLRQIRRNSVMPVLFLGMVGVLAGAEIVSSGIHSRLAIWGVGLILISMLSSYAVIRNLIKNGMYGNRKREVREVCSLLLAHYYQNSHKLMAQPNNSFNPTPQ